MDRSQHWLTLNGVWSFEHDDVTRLITVPFAWETEASGVGLPWLERATYRRELRVPDSWAARRIVLCFGAVHHHAVVRIDGATVGEHVGGYASFELDVTEHVSPGISVELEVVVAAPADKRAIPHGKQRSIPRDDYDGVSFTPTSGIWQPVWLEARGRTYARSVVLRGDSLTGIDVSVCLSGDTPAGAPVKVALDSGEHLLLEADADGISRGHLVVDRPRLWSPEDPHLYRVAIRVGEGDGVDEVVACTGLRRFEARGEKLYLNGERCYVRGVLDQGYWPRTGLTAPDQESLVADLDHASALGYNLVRKHLKLEEPAWLYEADRRGMLVWAEPPCPSRFSAEAARGFEDLLPSMVERDGNHPSIVIWGLYNEEWGLDWDIPGSDARAAAAAAAYDRMRELDATRPIVENSGWAHVRTDLVDWHYYEPDLATWRDAVAGLAAGDRDDFPVRLGPDFVVDKSLYGSADVPRHGLPIINSEYGEGFTSLERAWHLRWETQELRRHDRFAGYVYTELADVEHEAAGLLDAHRRPKDWGGCRPSDVNAETVLVFDLVPLRAGADIEPPSEPMPLDVRVSHHGRGPVSGSVSAAWVRPGAPMSTAPARPPVCSSRLTAEPFMLSASVRLDIPAISEPARLLLWFTDDDGEVRAQAFLDAAQVEPPNRRGARPGT
ncbi:glycoside hydrolase family 2 protein [Isoptericola sp. BMS4]|uniref:glycoside hydrolase family 2 protein n=1 Tax=Isoptericola sp. BMS4 TaxID=2527875 RepID=UPI001F114312|nr:glycoside hydrolase family 2 TIM barrel-domain containing protein [Isoptericola sp. BMS4]